jgi:hypothetical protein
METIKSSSDGRECKLSNVIYTIKDTKESREWLKEMGRWYKPGTKVRLISGVDGSTIPGYHFEKGYVTICRVDAITAEFIGIKKSFLEKIDERS